MGKDLGGAIKGFKEGMSDAADDGKKTADAAKKTANEAEKPAVAEKAPEDKKQA